MTHTAVILATPTLVPLPDVAKNWTTDRARAGQQRMVMIQFHVPHIGFHEVWQLMGVRDGENGPPFYEGFGRTVTNMARDYYERKWPGVSKDMVCTGGAIWTGEDYEQVSHMKHIR